MRIQIMFFMLLIVVGAGSAGTYQLGSHNVRFNLSDSAEIKIETPIYQPSIDAWWYWLNITTPSSEGYATLTVEETTKTFSTEAIQNLAALIRVDMINKGVEGYQDTIIDYKGNTALSTYVPAQSKMVNGTVYRLTSEEYSLTFTQDENTMVIVDSHKLNDTTYNELLDSLEITKAAVKIEHKPYVGPTSAYAGAGQGAKPGSESKNILAQV